MRAAVAIGGLVIAGCLGAYGAVEAQKYSITHEVCRRSPAAVSGITWESGTATAAAAPAAAQSNNVAADSASSVPAWP